MIRVWEGVAVSKEAMAFDAIARVGPGGYFMKDIHTLKHFKGEITLPRIAMRPSAPGAKEEPMRQAARDEARRILKEHRPSPIEKGARSEVKRILAEYDSKLHGKPVPTKYLDHLS